MRITSATYYKQYAKTVQDLHTQLNRSMEQISSGKKYDSASENPLAYYAGQKISSEYDDIEQKSTMITDVVNRLDQQANGAESIQSSMRYVNTDLMRLSNSTTSGETSTIDALNQDMKERIQNMTNSLNSTYENYYVFGGNDATTTPFTLTEADDGTSFTFTFKHTYPGDSSASTINMKYSLDDNNELVVDYSGTNADGSEMTDVKEKLVSAMTEQGKMSVGYGDINQLSTLPETFTNGLNVITGIRSDALRIQNNSSSENAQNNVTESMKTTPIALTIRAALSTNKYLKSESSGDESMSREELGNVVTDVIGGWDESEQNVVSSYEAIGNTQSALNDTKDRLDSLSDTLNKQYKDTLGVDPYDAIVQMYQRQYSYDAAMKVGSNVMQSNLFQYVQ